MTTFSIAFYRESKASASGLDPEAVHWIGTFAIVAAVVNSEGIVAIFRHRERAKR
ncbi:hypothetical protein GS429_00685 [Natronorubrum sp. JWXQ-INN-674]|uniref:Uncharacterized protein n=1 Tax=Natronorubrum halalkaliphilum TaxID=2691917 RepID=A0A6B0VJ26_9EURY|nr:hypothetical protein [Natronorubrum halalkaliphilum]MXV60609.1 hypothetical protein [Natronorubrum halalkaliphilum]